MQVVFSGAVMAVGERMCGVCQFRGIPGLRVWLCVSFGGVYVLVLFGAILRLGCMGCGGRKGRVGGLVGLIMGVRGRRLRWVRDLAEAISS